MESTHKSPFGNRGAKVAGSLFATPRKCAASVLRAGAFGRLAVAPASYALDRPRSVW